MYCVLIRLLAINFVAYIFFLTKCFNRERLIWNNNASPKMISIMLIRKILGQQHIKNVTSTCNSHDLELKTHGTCNQILIKFFAHYNPVCPMASSRGKELKKLPKSAQCTEIYSFEMPFVGHHYYILSRLKLCQALA